MFFKIEIYKDRMEKQGSKFLACGSINLSNSFFHSRNKRNTIHAEDVQKRNYLHICQFDICMQVAKPQAVSRCRLVARSAGIGQSEFVVV